MHRIDPSRPIRDVRGALGFIKERRIILSTGRSSLPTLAEAIAGRHLRGSWMAHPEVFAIYRILGQVHKSDRVVTAPLILGKEALLDASLGPAVARVAADPRRNDAARAQLPTLARRLLADVEANGEVRMDRWSVSTRRGRAARLLLERLLLVASRDLHTERGYHTAVLRPWRASSIAARFKTAAQRLTLEQAVDQLLLASVRAAVVVPEREVRRWFAFGTGRLALLVARGKIAQLQIQRTRWLTSR